MSEKTLFEQIIDREIPAVIRYEDERCIIIEDINPQAPVHLLMIPKQVLARLDQAEASDQNLLGHLLIQAKQFAQDNQLPGFRLVINNGKQAGESVPHMHIHILSGRPMAWPPG